MFERFTTGAREVVTGAHQAARDLGNQHIGTEHVLISMLRDENGTVARLLRERGLDAATARDDVRRLAGGTEPGPSRAETEAEDAAALKAIGIDLDKVRAAIEENFGAGALQLPQALPRKRGFFGRLYASGGHLPLTPRAKKLLELALREAVRLHQNFIGPEHIMLGLLREGEGLAARVLTEHRIKFDDLRTELERSLTDQAA
ncbi:Clp protease N-terminal domain-containing protein [Paractinoplanes ferrugineus]|uniref:ATP-dependent Clp protease n=1 Tax=Paractinoplanes ferrugineus TaxID=113564 RepID=A0A919MF02_9ACTN|nr:Clp protease N-terminal domain-containing protein [Actinoplanes ferrugineus]GIE12244.1 putative ATP-dependent Clp protease [Actinoplanes ferrugineus]